jgi:purine-binding chemotaxis protein CheW
MTIGGEGDQALIVTAGTRACAIPARDVVETMRPRPVEAIAGLPAFVWGVSVSRGVPIPLIDLGTLLQSGYRRDSCGRFVTVRIGERRAAVAVDSVVGLRNFGLTAVEELPPLLRDSDSPVIEAIGTRDAQLLVVLRAIRLVPDETWIALETRQAAR